MGKPTKMIPLLTQAQYENLIRRNNPKVPENKVYNPRVGIAFGAEWCGPCRRLDKDAIADATPEVQWYYCDIDENDYTPGYCGIRGVPAFVMILDGVFQSNKLVGPGSVQQVVTWSKSM